MTRVLVVDDDPLVRSALALMLGGQPDLDVVGEAPDGRVAIAFSIMARISTVSSAGSARRGGRVRAEPRPAIASQSLMHWTRSGRASRWSKGMNQR